MQNNYQQIKKKIIEVCYETEIDKIIESWEQILAKNGQQDQINLHNLCNFLAKELPEESFLNIFLHPSFGYRKYDPQQATTDIAAIADIGILTARNNNFFVVKDNNGLASVAIHPFIPVTRYPVRYLAPKQTIQAVLDKADTRIIAEFPQHIEQIKQNPGHYFQYIIQRAIRLKSSDIHIEYYPHLKKSFVKVRKDGYLITLDEIYNPGGLWHYQFTNYVFNLADIDSGIFHKIHDKQIEYPVFGETCALRLSIVPSATPGGQQVPQHCYRIMVSDALDLNSLDKIGLYPSTSKKLYQLIKQPNGIICICGPTGSGKNTTLYVLLNILLKEEPIKILAVEDPVEKRLTPPPDQSSGIVQVEVATKRDITFSSALRSFLRHDPDVIFIGETRDEETATTAIKAALTGHLVFTTLHVNNSYDTIPRLVNTLGVEKDLLATALRGVLSQRLVRRVCPHCALTTTLNLIRPLRKHTKGIFTKKYIYSDTMLSDILSVLPGELQVKVPVGCSYCRQTGYLGRIAMTEILLSNSENFEALFVKGNRFEAFNDGQSEPMILSAYRLLRDQITTLDEVMRFITLDDMRMYGIDKIIEQEGIDAATR